MTTPNLDEIERLARAATPGPWKVDNRASTRVMDTYDTTIASAGTASRVLENSQANASYIAAMSPDVAQQLVQRVRVLEGAEANHENRGRNTWKRGRRGWQLKQN